MRSYLKLRTIFIVVVIAVFAAAMFPLTPRDFYLTFKENVKPESLENAENLVKKAQNIQKLKPDLYPSSALLMAADGESLELNKLVESKPNEDNSEVIAKLRKKASSSIRLGLDLNGGVEFVLDLNPDYSTLAESGMTKVEAEKKLKSNFNQYRDLAMEALRKRLEAQNIFETEIVPFGANGLSLKAPIVSPDEKDKLQKLIQISNKLEFHLVHVKSNEILASNRNVIAPNGYRILTEEGKSGDVPRRAVVADKIEMTGSGIEQSFVTRSEYGQLGIALRFNGKGAADFARITKANIGRQLAILLDGKLYCAPVINGEITGGQAEISGKFSAEEAKLIADALTSGSFPFKIDVAAHYDTAPTLGADNVRNGIYAGLVALVLLASFMIIYYHKCGVVAVVALSTNVVLILGAMAAFGATLTMPGIAGIILTLGMAVDANVLVFERMREETEAGKNPVNAVEAGFKKAYSSVMDGNLTTLAVALILMYFGTGAVKGFAVSLSIGIIFSLFTALFMSHVIFEWLLKLGKLPKITMLKFFSKPNIGFMRQSKWAVRISLALMIFSVAICLFKGENMLSVDFTGGTLISCNYKNTVPIAGIEEVLSANNINGRATYKSNGSAQDNKKLEILIRKGGSSDVQKKVMPLLAEKFPELGLSDGQTTSVGGMVGAEMSKNAVVSILLAFLGMIIYVAVRYELSFAVAGILALVHDAVIALGIFVLFGRELSLPVVAGILTIIGYSINDTIVIFDRIREEIRLNPSINFAKIVDDSLNRTLSRTILTSLTTFLVVFVMFLFGGIAINDFIFIIMLGIIIGSYSSLYIASPIIVAYHNYKNKRQNAAK